MSHNLNDIKRELVNNIKSIFDESIRPTYNDFGNNFNFEEGIDLFFKVLIHRCGVNDLDGLSNNVIPTLSEAYLTNKGDLRPIKILAFELEAFLKKIVYLTSDETLNYANDYTKTLIPLYKHLEIIASPYPNLVLDNLPLFKGSEGFLEYICNAYLVRNTVHSSPNWTLKQVANNLESILVVYLFATFKYSDKLTQKVSQIILPSSSLNEENLLTTNTDKQALYDLISSTNSTYQIRNQIVTSFILHILNANNGKLTLDQIRDQCNIQFKTNTEISFYKNIVRELSKDNIKKVILSGIFENDVTLSEAEKNRIKKVKEDFYFQEQLFILEITEVLKKYSIELNINGIISNLTELFNNNYNIDLYEVYDKGFEAIDNVINLKNFVSYLKSIVDKESDAEEVFRELLIVCEKNDFLHKIATSQVFAKITNPLQLEHYLNQKERIVYLDTNILLHSLCYYYNIAEDDEYKNIYYQTTKELLIFAKNHANLKLKTSPLYVYEVAYQLKEALLLIPFEEISLFDKVGNSTNVFYNFYLFIRENDLDENISSFSEFMEGFELNEDNLNSKDFLNNTSSLVNEFLEAVGIEIIELPFYEKEDAFEIVKNSLVIASKLKALEPMNNDAKMICHLSNKSAHLNSPTFVTWDTTFFDIRKKYLSKFRHSKMWHLFTPSKLLNHLQLLEFKINAQSITNEFLTIIDSVHFQEKTKNLLDVISQLLDLEKEERRRYLSKFKEFSAQYIFELDQNTQENPIEAIENKPVEKLVMELNKHYANKVNKYNFTDFKNLLRQKTLFDEIISVFQIELDNYMKERSFSNNLFTRFDKMISVLKKDQ